MIVKSGLDLVVVIPYKMKGEAELSIYLVTFRTETGYMNIHLALQAGSLTKCLSQRDQPKQTTEQQLNELQLCLIVIDKTIPG